MMDDTTAVPASSLAITEKRPPKPGGCVGIFFQLLDWNRRFAKKKLFSRKLLPPGRAKQASNKLGGNEKMPRSQLHLISEENKGGFPNSKMKNSHTTANGEQKHEMRAPSLVAKLMGLDSIPAVKRIKSKKDSLTEECNRREDKTTKNHIFVDTKDLTLAKRNPKLESRPQKIQKVGVSDKQQSVARFGAEALHIKSVLSRSRKHQHPKLISPIKSPRLSTVKSNSRAARLIDVATRILEPGLQASNRAKRGITYSVPSAQNRVGYVSHDYSREIEHGMSPCKNCGSLVDVEEQFYDCGSSVPSSVSSPGPQESRMVKPSSLVQDRNAVFTRSWVGIQEEDTDDQSSSDTIAERKSVLCESKPQRNELPSSVLKHRSRAPNRMYVERDRIPSEARLSNLQSRRASSAATAVGGGKDFVALNRTLSGRTRPRVTTAKLDDANYEVDKKSYIRREDPIPIPPSRPKERKRRITSVNGQVQGSGMINSTSLRQKNVGSDIGIGRDSRTNIRSTGRRQSIREEGSRVRSEKDRRKASSHPTCKNGSIQKQTTLLIDREISLQNQLPWKGDALGALLEQRLKELSSCEEDDLTAGTNMPKRSTAAILQELISALTLEQQGTEDVSSTDISCQTDDSINTSSVEFTHKADHLSPGSVLEVSFSNETCISSSLEESSDLNMNPGSRLHQLSYSRPQQQVTGPDTELLDSATSFNNGRTSYVTVTKLVNYVNSMLDNLNHTGLRLTGSKLAHSKEIIYKVELLFGTENFLISPRLLDELVSYSTSNNLTLKVGSNLTRAFLFDCMIEYLDTNYVQCASIGFKTQARIPLYINSKTLSDKIGKEVKKWTLFTDMEIKDVDNEMSDYSVVKLTDFDIEVFEMVSEIEYCILQVLVEEVVRAFCDCRIRLGY